MAGNQAAMCDLVHSRIEQTEVRESLLGLFPQACHPNLDKSKEVCLDHVATINARAIKVCWCFEPSNF